MDQLSSAELYRIFKECKSSNFAKEPNFDEVLKQVSKALDVPASDKLLSDIKSIFLKYKKQQQKSQATWSTKRSDDDDQGCCLLKKTYMKTPKRPLTEVSDRQQRRRLSTFMEAAKSQAREENTSPSKLFAHGLKSKYLENKDIGLIGKSLFNENDISAKSCIPLEVASAIFECAKMSKRVYTDVRILLKNAGADVLPTYKKLDEFRKQRRPEVVKLDIPYHGVRFDYLKCLEITTSQLCRSIALPAFKNLREIKLVLHDGLDGSGGHSIFNQAGSQETNNIIMYMFRIEMMKDTSDNIIWENPSHASPLSCRPVMLLMGKETRDNCKIVSKIQEERQGSSFYIDYKGNRLKVNVEAKMSMVDGKLHSLLTGLGGAFCCLCTFTKEECRDPDLITTGFTINRTLEQTLSICNKDLHLQEQRRVGDYDVRKGVTQEPITTEDMNTLHPLHNLLRCFGWLFKICYHATAGHFSWSEAKLDVSNRVAHALEFLKIAKESIQEKVKSATSITLEKADPTGHGGTSTTGNVAKAMLNTENRKLLTQGIDSTELRGKIDTIVLNMSVILSIINSSKKVNVDEYRVFCRDTYILVASLEWIEFTPSAHIVLAHSPDLIDQNHGMGLLNYTECGLEANNKFLRQYRINKARKTSQFDNLSDCINRLWDKSDPIVMNVRERLHCKHCDKKGHTIRSCSELKAAIQSCSSEYESLLSFLTRE